jgi:16S rRNA (cytosine1402-N4)-methyltransferase
MYHVPVMLKECIDNLIANDSGVYVDLTFGGGGHSNAILERLSSSGKLYAFDADPDAVQNSIADERFTLIQANYRHLSRFLKLHGVTKVDGILADLGVSSFQLDNAAKGFSIRYDAPLDMRMSKQGKTSAEILNTYSVKELSSLWYRYAEISNAGALAKAIVERRMIKPFESTSELVNVAEIYSYGKKNKYLAQVFQALRIEVNEEIIALEEMLMQVHNLLKPKGRLVVLSYHSLEDRPTKNLIKAGNVEGVIEKDLYGNYDLPFKSLHKKPILPTAEEIYNNNRARSAKLRVAERI